jgi:aminopeptidase-like protein
MAFLWILNLADGRHTLLDIAERAQLPFGVVAEAARLLRDSGLLVEDRAAGQPQALKGVPAANEA